MNAPSSILPPPISLDSRNATSSPALVSGHIHCDKPDGLTTDLSGPVPARANLSARQAKVLGLMTSGTYGQHGSTSSNSVRLQSCLANKLRRRLSTAGSILFRQTWKELTTPSGRALWAHTASAHRTSGSGCGSWPTPNTPSGGRSVSIEKMSATGVTLDGRKHTVSLEHVARFASWPTPVVNDELGSQYCYGPKKPDGTRARFLKLPGAAD